MKTIFTCARAFLIPARLTLAKRPKSTIRYSVTRDSKLHNFKKLLIFPPNTLVIRVTDLSKEYFCFFRFVKHWFLKNNNRADQASFVVDSLLVSDAVLTQSTASNSLFLFY